MRGKLNLLVERRINSSKRKSHRTEGIAVLKTKLSGDRKGMHASGTLGEPGRTGR